jgi:hypothetical protein
VPLLLSRNARWETRNGGLQELDSTSRTRLQLLDRWSRHSLTSSGESTLELLRALFRWVRCTVVRIESRNRCRRHSKPVQGVLRAEGILLVGDCCL